VSTEIYYPVSLHEQECFLYLDSRTADLQNSHAASKETMALPIYPELTDEQRRYVIDAIAAFYRKT
jgi:dTDP-4-amino-4,6-dideoxygalactose transaminase